jgi:hypothetical protein
MKNYFIILNDRIELMYQGRTFELDLNDGDKEDYWNSFTYNGEELDINYYPVLESLSIYSVHDDKGQIDTSQFDKAEFIGDLSDKYIIINVTESYLSHGYMKRYNDSNEIIIYDNYTDCRDDISRSGHSPLLISGLSINTLTEILTEKINQYERNNTRRSA